MQSSKSPIFSGALGEYNGVVLREAQDVTAGVSPDGMSAVPLTRRAVLLGAQAATIAYGKAGGDTRVPLERGAARPQAQPRGLGLGDLGPEEDDLQRRRLRHNRDPTYAKPVDA